MEGLLKTHALRLTCIKGISLCYILFSKPFTPSFTSTEVSVLLTRGAKHRTTSRLWVFLSIIVAFCLGCLFVTSSENHTAAQQAWQRELHQHELLREGWQIERQSHELEREQWQRERDEYDRERKERERERDSDRPFWDEPRLSSERCLTYETREYTARLWNIQLSSEWHKACMSQPISIHDRTLPSPDRCENRVSACNLSPVDSDELLLGYGGRSMGLLDRQFR